MSFQPIINPATKYFTFSRSVPACNEASKCRCSTSTASFDNAVREQTHDGLSFNIKRLEPQECMNTYGLVSIFRNTFAYK
jgi:hypothetical protein